MNKRDIKHRDELYKASAIISQLGFVPDESMCDDCPDLILPSVDNRKIGIEVVTYSTQIYEQSENALYKILDEYVKNKLDKTSEKRYEISIYFIDDVNIPIDINYKKAKKQIYTELDSLLLSPQPLINRQYIENVIKMENPGATHSFISCDKVVVYETLNEQVLLDCINHKERKLKKYKTLQKNITIQEYYLVIFFPIDEHAELRGYTLPNSFKTEYNRIYLVDDFYTNQIV